MDRLRTAANKVVIPSAPKRVDVLPPVTPEEYAGMKAADLALLVQSRIQACMDANTTDDLLKTTAD